MRNVDVGGFPRLQTRLDGLNYFDVDWRERGGFLETCFCWGAGERLGEDAVCVPGDS